jgi:parvulin-like peptidyl-prolyl isomerase
VVEAPVPPEKVVLKVGEKQFTKAEMDALIGNLPPQAQRSLATQGKKPLAEQFALMVMLSRQAENHHLDQTPEFVHKLAFQKQQLEAQSAYEEINQQAKVTPEEAQQYYTAHAADYDEITVRQFVVRIKAAAPPVGSAPATPPTGSGLSPEEATARAAAIRKELAAGTDIKKVVEDFKAPGDVIIEAEPRKIRHGGMRPEMEKVAFGLKDGEISEPINVPQALVFFQVTGHGRAELKDVIPEIEKNLRQQKIDAAMAELKKNAAVWMDDQYFAAPPKPQAGPTLGPPAVNAPPKP